MRWRKPWLRSPRGFLELSARVVEKREQNASEGLACHFGECAHVFTHFLFEVVVDFSHIFLIPLSHGAGHLLFISFYLASYFCAKRLGAPWRLGPPQAGSAEIPNMVRMGPVGLRVH